jgi:hypothetical protein
MVLPLVVIGFAIRALAQVPLTPSPKWAQAMPPGPTVGTRMTAEYVKQVGRMAYFWAWPMMNIQSRLITFRRVTQFAFRGGVLPVGPVNEVTMLTDYIDPSERAVACPNQDVVYGQAVLDMAKEPVVIQVPDFANGQPTLRLVSGKRCKGSSATKDLAGGPVRMGARQHGAPDTDLSIRGLALTELSHITVLAGCSNSDQRKAHRNPADTLREPPQQDGSPVLLKL